LFFSKGIFGKNMEFSEKTHYIVLENCKQTKTGRLLLNEQAIPLIDENIEISGHIFSF
jgi:hypothetical protein